MTRAMWSWAAAYPVGGGAIVTVSDQGSCCSSSARLTAASEPLCCTRSYSPYWDRLTRGCGPVAVAKSRSVRAAKTRIITKRQLLECCGKSHPDFSVHTKQRPGWEGHDANASQQRRRCECDGQNARWYANAMVNETIASE